MAVAARARSVAVPAPVTAPRVPRVREHPAARPARRPRIGRGVVLIGTVGVLLAGIVALNVAVLQLRVSTGGVADEVTKIRAENAALVADLSSATAVGRIESLGRGRLGLVDAGHPTYVRLRPAKRHGR